MISKLTTAGRYALLGLLVALPATAQQRQPSAEAEVKTKAPTIGPAEIQRAEAYVQEMRRAADAVAKMVAAARKENDIIKLDCVNNKFLEINGNLDVAEKALNPLKLAVAGGKLKAASHEFSKITIAHQKVVVLKQDAEACVGEEIAFVGKSKVTVKTTKNIRKDDPTTEQANPAPVGRQPVASPAGT